MLHVGLSQEFAANRRIIISLIQKLKRVF